MTNNDVLRIGYCCVPECPVVLLEDMLYTFPKDVEIKQQWIDNCKITQNITDEMLICSSHFMESDYETVQKNCKQRKLKETAIPTKNLPLFEFVEPNKELENYVYNAPDIIPKQPGIEVNNRQGGKRKCCLLYCKTKPEDRRSFHYLPKDPNVRQKWIDLCKLGKRYLSNYANVCSAHFQESDYLTDLKSARRVLKPNAVPSLNLPRPSIENINEPSADKQSNETATHSSTAQNYNDTSNPIQSNTNFEMPIPIKIGLNGESSSTSNEIIQSIMKRPIKIKLKSNSDDLLSPTKIMKKIVIKKTENVSIAIKQHQNKNFVLKRQAHEQGKIKLNKPIKPDINKYYNNTKNFTTITLCSECSQYCKIEDEDFLDVKVNSTEILAVETLLELQELNSTNESEHISLSKKGIEICDKILQKEKVDLINLLSSDNELIAFTGIDFPLLNKLTSLVTLFEGNSAKRFSETAKNRIVMCLCKLRTNLPFRCVATLFGISCQLCISYFAVMVRTLSILLEKLIYWPSIDEVSKKLPKCFQSFKQTRVILNCTETEIEKQRCSKCQSGLPLDKKFETLKLILGVAPSGLIIFRSSTFETRTSDPSILTQINILNYLDPAREAVMTDNTLSIEDECAKCNITLIKAPKLSKEKGISKADVEQIKNITAARIHVDRTLHRFKMFKIMQTKISWRIFPHIDDICIIIAGIINMRNPIPPDESRILSTLNRR